MPVHFSVCANCGASFHTHSSRPDIRFCSIACRSAYPAIKRLYERTDFNGPVVSPELGPCWDFPFSLVQGYGTIGDGHGKVVKAHRLAYREAYGDDALPDGLLLRHKCDRRVCIRPDHGEPGTHHDNMQDAVLRGRKPRTTGTFLPGEHHRRSKLTDAEARQAYAMARGGMMFKDVAAIFGVSRTVVEALCHGLRRKHLGLAPF